MRSYAAGTRLRALLLAVFVVTLGALIGAPVSAAGRTHTVVHGNTLWSIAHANHVSVDALREINGLKKGEPIRVGQKLIIPSKGWKKKSSSHRRASAKLKGTARQRSGTYIAKPPPWTQVQKSAKERGVNPCNTPDPGWGVYTHWDRGVSMGQFIAPQRGGITRSGAFDVMFHFHGHEAVRKEWVQVMHGAVLVGIDLGIGSGPYAHAFQGPNTFKRLVESIEAQMAKKTGKKHAHVRHVGLSAWSAGYGAVGEILQQPYAKKVVDTVVLLDGLHCGYVGRKLEARQIEPFIHFAKLAARGHKYMFVSHSSIIPPGYASTTETAHLLIRKVGGHFHRAHPRPGDPMGMDLIGRYDRGNFHVRGYAGNDKMDHCAHVGLYHDILKVHIRRRWRSPRGYKKHH